MNIDHAADTAGRLSELGTVAIVLFLFICFGAGVAIFVTWVGRRLFGDGGIAERVTTSHIEFLSRLDRAIAESVESQKRVEQVARKTDSTIRSLLLANVLTNERLDNLRLIWKRNVAVLRGIARKFQLTDIEGQLDEMENLLDVEISDELLRRKANAQGEG